MRLLGKQKLMKLKKKNMGNTKLLYAIDKLISELESLDPSVQEISDVRKDADCVHNDGFYFFDLQVHRTLLMIELDDQGEATIIWVGTHQEYESIFKNNKKTIEKWLRKHGYIE